MKVSQAQKEVEAREATIEQLQAAVSKPLAVLREAKNDSTIAKAAVVNATIALTNAMRDKVNDSNAALWSAAIREDVSNPNRAIAMARLGQNVFERLCRLYVGKDQLPQLSQIGKIAVSAVCQGDLADLADIVLHDMQDDEKRDALASRFMPKKGAIDKIVDAINRLDLAQLGQVESKVRERRKALKEESAKAAASIDVAALSEEQRAALLASLGVDQT